MNRLQTTLGLALASAAAPLLMGSSHGAWLRRVPAAAHMKRSPFLPSEMPQAAAGGAQVFHDSCAKCHGEDGMGRGSHPPVVSPRVAGASDGDLFWLMTNGNPWRGMPAWQSLPPAERWQLVAYLRELNAGEETERQVK